MDVVDVMVWVFRDQEAHVVDGRGIGLFEGERAMGGKAIAGRSMTAVVGEIATVGCMIDRDGYDLGQLHPMAEAVFEIVDEMPNPYRGLLVKFGKLGALPDGYDADWRLGPKWKYDPDHPTRARHDSGGDINPKAIEYLYDANRHAIACALEPDHPPYFIEALRDEYRTWHDGLCAVVRRCSAPSQRKRLERLVVTGPTLPSDPWSTPRRHAS
jgi:hypothetical protein